MARLLADWLTSYVDFCFDSEPPTSYHQWTGLSLIASTLQRRAFMTWGYSEIYPNMYIVLVGPSGRTKKGTALKIGKAILNDVFGTDSEYIVGESITREALIQLMQSNVTTFTDDEGKIFYQSPLTVFSEELSVFLGQNELRFLSMLIDWYDSGDIWKYKTKNSGSFEISGVCLNILAATAPAWIAQMIPKEARDGGFASRVFFIVEFDKQKTVALPKVNPDMKLLRKKLVHDLEEIKTIKGEYFFSKEAEEFYAEWYTRQDFLMSQGRSPLKNESKELMAYCERRATHIKKVAMNLTASRTNERIIQKSDLERALLMMEAAETNMTRAYDGVSDSKYGEAIQVILDLLIKKKELKRSDFLREYFKRFDVETVMMAEQTLEKMGMIKIRRLLSDNDTVYSLREEF